MVLLDPVPAYAIKTTADDGSKVFVNVCSDPHVPPPSTLDPGEIALHVANGGDWVAPVAVGLQRIDKDKAGQPCVVFDCVLNPKVLLLGIQEPEIKLLIVETCIELAEDAGERALSRDYKLPKLKSRGTPVPFEMPESQEFQEPPSSLISTALDPQPSPSKVGLIPVKIDENSSVGSASVDAPASLPAAPIAPQIIELANGESDDGYWHIYRGPWSGDGPRPTWVLEMPGKPATLRLSGPEVRWTGGKRKLPFVPTRYDAVYVRADDTTYLFIWKG